MKMVGEGGGEGWMGEGREEEGAGCLAVGRAADSCVLSLSLPPRTRWWPCWRRPEQ